MSGLLSHNPDDIVRRLLIARGHGADPPSADWPVYAAIVPDGPDELLVVTDTAGRDLGRDMVVSRREELYGVQVRVRSLDPKRGGAKARAVAVDLDVVLDQYVGVETSGYLVHGFPERGSVIFAGFERGSKRLMYTINALAGLKQVL